MEIDFVAGTLVTEAWGLVPTLVTRWMWGMLGRNSSTLRHSSELLHMYLQFVEPLLTET
jgi:hypothetical protein